MKHSFLVVLFCATAFGAQEQDWDAYKKSHSLVMLIKHGPANKERYLTLRLDELIEDGQTSPEGDTYTFFGSGDFLPRGTPREMLVPDDSEKAYAVQRVVSAGEEQYNYMVVALTTPFEKCFHMVCSADYTCITIDVVPNEQLEKRTCKN